MSANINCFNGLELSISDFCFVRLSVRLILSKFWKNVKKSLGLSANNFQISGSSCESLPNLSYLSNVPYRRPNSAQDDTDNQLNDAVEVLEISIIAVEDHTIKSKQINIKIIRDI